MVSWHQLKQVCIPLSFFATIHMTNAIGSDWSCPRLTYQGTWYHWCHAYWYFWSDSYLYFPGSAFWYYQDCCFVCAHRFHLAASKSGIWYLQLHSLWCYSVSSILPLLDLPLVCKAWYWWLENDGWYTFMPYWCGSTLCWPGSLWSYRCSNFMAPVWISCKSSSSSFWIRSMAHVLSY